MKKNCFLAVALFLFTPALVLAGEGGPFPLVFHQAFNLSIVLGAIIYFARPAIIDYFNLRREQYVLEFEKVSALKKDAEAKLKDVEQRLLLLEKTKADSIYQAQQEAHALSKKLLRDAEEAAERVRREATAAAAAEVQRAKQKLLEKMSQAAIAEAQNILSKDISGADQGRLQESLLRQI
jgi:F-type H+-transporting ATPase subunit b